ncbi:MAG TPA: M14 family metallopeptidase, partial [Gemmatimonadaceae bacterium]|nr:M14 family metallopeptidase [Gemmatimonadaceae bacterium]
MMRASLTSAIALAAILAASTANAAYAQRAPRNAQRAMPTPAAVLGFEPGEDRKLPSWRQVVEYFTRLDAASARVQVRTLGRTTLGRPFIAVLIADSATLAQLPRYRDIQRKLADPRLQRANERARLLADGKVVVLVTSSIHSTEVGAILTPLVLAHRLVTDEGEEMRAVRRNAITILVPSLNPDGVDIVRDWYSATLGTPAEGTSPPQLYHHYVGHDNNRDWYAFTQVETQLTIDSLHNVWHPQIVNDIHQQGAYGSRIFIPPYMDPIEPNVDPLLVAGVNQMGMAMTWRMLAEGKTGIANNASYDAWTPARAYQHYHGGIRILTETASARLATPMDLPFDSLVLSRGYDPKVPSWNFTAPWPGGRWTIRNIIDYQTSATWALLAEAARDRATWLQSFARLHERAVQGREAPGRKSWPVAFAIPSTQRDTVALHALLRVLERGQVEIYAARGFSAGGMRFPDGTLVIPITQPYGAFAKALLERQKYPDLREYPGGPPKQPYDVTAHTLPLLMGVEVATIAEGELPEGARVHMFAAVVDTVGVPAGASGVTGGATAPLRPQPPASSPQIAPPAVEGLSDSTTRRIALYRSFVPSMDEGWTRWIFDQYRIRYTSITDRDVRAGGGALRQRFDVILIPDQSPRSLERGPSSQYPDSLRGGLGAEGAAALRAFVEQGGTLVAFNDASNYAV